MQDIDIIGDADSSLFEQFIQNSNGNIQIASEGNGEDDVIFEDETIDENGEHSIPDSEIKTLIQTKEGSPVGQQYKQVSVKLSQTGSQNKYSNPNDQQSRQAKYLTESQKHIQRFAQAQATSNFTDFLSQEYIQNVILLMAIILFILVFKLILTYCPCFVFITDAALKDAVYVLFREVVIVICGLIILQGLTYYSVLNIDKDKVIGIIYCVLLALLFWTLLGFTMVLSAQKNIKKWKEYEKIANDYNQLEKIKTQYENIYYRIQNNARGNEFDEVFIEKIEYFVMRLQFIHPIYLPPTTESFLRKDFNYAQYLGYAYGKTLKNFFNTTWVSLLVIMILVDGTRALIITSQNEYQAMLQILDLFPPVLFLLIFVMFFFSFVNIEKQLYPRIIQQDGTYIKPEEINFHINYDVIDPFNLYDNFPQPSYLEINYFNEAMQDFENSRLSMASHSKQDQDEEQSQMIDEERDSASNRSSMAPRKTREFPQYNVEKLQKSSWLCFDREDRVYGSAANRHEKLFCCGKGGVTFARTLLQVIYLLSVIYLAVYVVFNAQNIYQKYKSGKTDVYITVLVSLIVCPIIMVIIWAVIIPLILSKYTIITNIEMMKDKSIIERVVNEQKLEKSRRSHRVFQAMKLIRRKLASELRKQIQDKRLRGFTKKQIVESFSILGGQKSKSVKMEALKSLVRLCGQELSPHEYQILYKKLVNIEAKDKIMYREFTQVVEQIMNDVKADPYTLVFNLFKLFFEGKDHVSYEQLLQFFTAYQDDFHQDDIESFKIEIQFIKRGSDEVYFQEIASMIRDDIEHFPK